MPPRCRRCCSSWKASVDRLRQVLGLTASETVRLVDRLAAAGLVRRGPGADAEVDLGGSHGRPAPGGAQGRGPSARCSRAVRRLSNTEREPFDGLLAKILVAQDARPGPNAGCAGSATCGLRTRRGRCRVAEAPRRGAQRSRPAQALATSLSAVETPVVGVVGAGQLARMMQQAAVGLGVPSGGSRSRASLRRPSHPATQGGGYRDLETLRAWATDCRCVTFDHGASHKALDQLWSPAVMPAGRARALVHAQDQAVTRAGWELESRVLGRTVAGIG